ncbi:MAG: hypothetical protein R3300_20675, partial [Candidatus Promineifilaceae bacterium]|nr:hypothetical protein [Candidatus Promineifilaceae bacterium]
IVQAGVYGSADAYRFFGDLAVNHRGDMVIGYTRVQPGNIVSGYPGVWVAGRHAEDPLNQLGAETAVRISTSPYVSAFPPTAIGAQRWGDYTGMASDPNGSDFWYVGQYSKAEVSGAANWGTFVGCMRMLPNNSQSGQRLTVQSDADFNTYLPLIGTALLPCR